MNHFRNRLKRWGMGNKFFKCSDAQKVSIKRTSNIPWINGTCEKVHTRARAHQTDCSALITKVVVGKNQRVNLTTVNVPCLLCVTVRAQNTICQSQSAAWHVLPTHDTTYAQFTPPDPTRHKLSSFVAAVSAVWIGFLATQDCRRRNIWNWTSSEYWKTQSYIRLAARLPRRVLSRPQIDSSCEANRE